MDRRSVDRLWRVLDQCRLRGGSTVTLSSEEAGVVLLEVRSLQRIVREMGTGEALLVRDVFETLGLDG